MDIGPLYGQINRASGTWLVATELTKLFNLSLSRDYQKPFAFTCRDNSTPGILRVMSALLLSAIRESEKSLITFDFPQSNMLTQYNHDIMVTGPSEQEIDIGSKIYACQNGGEKQEDSRDLAHHLGF